MDTIKKIEDRIKELKQIKENRYNELMQEALDQIEKLLNPIDSIINELEELLK